MEQPFKFVWFEEFWFVWFDLFIILDERLEPIACLVFYFVINISENLYKKPYQTWQAALKTFKKTSKYSNENT